MVHVGFRVDKVMVRTGFIKSLGPLNFLPEDQAIEFLFQRVLDPAICIYECPVKVFAECQNLPKQLYPDLLAIDEEYATADVHEVTANELWNMTRKEGNHIKIIDIREPREYRRGHIPGAQILPLPEILMNGLPPDFMEDSEIVFACRSGRRSRRAALRVRKDGQEVRILKGGMIAWQAAELLEAVDHQTQPGDKETP
jgi:SulP family sulfate permease